MGVSWQFGQIFCMLLSGNPVTGYAYIQGSLIKHALGGPQAFREGKCLGVGLPGAMEYPQQFCYNYQINLMENVRKCLLKEKNIVKGN